MSNICSQFHTALQFSLFQKKTKKYTFLPSDKWQNWCKWGWGRWITCFFQLLFQTSNLGNCARNFLFLKIKQFFQNYISFFLIFLVLTILTNFQGGLRASFNFFFQTSNLGNCARNFLLPRTPSSPQQPSSETNKKWTHTKWSTTPWKKAPVIWFFYQAEISKNLVNAMFFLMFFWLC